MGKGKGGAWEREVSRVLTEWLTGERNPPQMWRSTQSGGWKHAGDTNVGDLAPNGEYGERFLSMFAVECKKGYSKDLDFWFVWSRENPLISQWWAKICEEASGAGRCPLLIIKRDYYPTIIGMPASFNPPPPDCKSIVVSGLTAEVPDVRFRCMEDYLQRNSPDDVYKEFEKWKTKVAR